MKIKVNHCFLPTLFLCILTNCLSQEKLKPSPFCYSLSYLGDNLINTQGGLRMGYTYLGMANLKISFDTETAGFWKGGELFINGANTHGGEPSATLVGDFQGVSNIEAGELTYLHELWYKQSFNKFEFILGLQDLNTEFAQNEIGSLFINSSFGVHSTLAENVPSPIFPLTRLGITIKWELLEGLDFKVSLFDGLRFDYQKNDYNLNWDLSTREGILYISEIKFSKSLFKDKPGSYIFGFYNHNHQVQQELTNDWSYENNMGMYMVINQLICKNSKNAGGLGFFTQLGLSNKNKNNHFAYLGCGIHYCGFSEKRCTDEIGLAIAQTWFKSSITGNETAIELSYKAILGDHIFIQPDLQYIINPSGTDSSLSNSLVSIFRFGINF